MTKQPPEALTHLHIARVTIEACTPISSGSGDADARFDMVLARDGNGLPRLQGASIQGVLRSLWPDRAEAKNLFGFQDRNEAQAGRITVSDGAVHRADDKAVSGRVDQQKITADGVLKLLIEEAPIRRDHVRLTHRSVVDGHGKFERLAVPIGTRFSFEMTMWGAENEIAVFKTAIDLIADPRFRPGGATGRGYGAVKLIGAATWSAPLAKTQPQRLIAVRQTPLSERPKPEFVDCVPKDATESPFFGERSLKLTPVGPWRIGSSGLASATEGPQANHPDADARKEPDLVPIREPAIVWDADRAANGGKPVWPLEKAGYLVPGASVKGVIAHRALFHFNCLKQRWADSAADVAKFQKRPPELVAIFGAERGADGSDKDGAAGRLFIDDVIVTDYQSVTAFDHNSIDRFTGGVRHGALFSEEVVMGGTIALELRLLPARERVYSRHAIEALNAAIADLCEGRLALGAKSLGYCKGAGPVPAFPIPDTPPAQGEAT